MLRTFCVWVEYFNQPEKKKRMIIKSKRVHAGKDLKEVNFEINIVFLVITVRVHQDFTCERWSQLSCCENSTCKKFMA